MGLEPNTLGDAPSVTYTETYQSVYPGEDAVVGPA
jgi:hypothetical protein